MRITLYFDANEIKKHLSSLSSSSDHRNNKSIEQNISESKPENIKMLLIPNFIFISKCALDKIAESMSFNVCKSSSSTNHQFLLNFLFKGGTKSLFYHYYKVKTSLRDIFRAYLWYLRKSCERYHKRFWGTKLSLFLVLYFCRSQQLITHHYVLGTSSA